MLRELAESDRFIKRSSQTYSVPSPWCFGIFYPGWVEEISGILISWRWSEELLPGLVPLGAAGDTGEPWAPLGHSPGTGASAQPCSWVSCTKCTVFCFFFFFQAVFGCRVCCLPEAAWWWRGEAVNGKAPAGIPLCVLSLRRISISSCSVSFCGVSACLHRHTLVTRGDASLRSHQTKTTTVFRLGCPACFVIRGSKR